jgi:hypothetical protein
LARWSDPHTWGGRVPGPGDIAVVPGTVLLDTDAHVAVLSIPAGASLIFDPSASRTLTTQGNVVVDGLLQMRPAHPATSHQILFVGIDEKRFVGGGKVPLPTDVGLWVVGAGRLDAVGSAKRAWTRATGDVPQGTSTIGVQDASGWQLGDELVITPTISPVIDNHWSAYDVARIVGLSGNTVRLDRPTSQPHPAVTVAPGQVMTAEVLNLTRNVRVEGTPEGRAHTFFHSTAKQALSYVGVRWVGPQQQPPGSQWPHNVLGRYGVHFHLGGDALRGQTNEGVVVRDAGAHAFVSHNTNGLTWRDCISHDTEDEAYWWDVARDSASYNVTYDRCVASHSVGGPSDGGFTTGSGDGNAMRGCVAVGMVGGAASNGFHWDSQGSPAWVFEDCVAHNIDHMGIRVWKNGGSQVITRFTAYHNGSMGVSHGAYDNSFQYRDCVLYGNRDGAIDILARPADPSPIRFDNVRCDITGMGKDYAVRVGGNVIGSHTPTVFSGCTFVGYGKAAVLAGSTAPYDQYCDLVNCTFGGNELWLDTGMTAGSRVRIQDRARGALLARRVGQPGAPRPQWNASVTPISPFA